jgi:type III secretory pathway component EscS
MKEKLKLFVISNFPSIVSFIVGLVVGLCI